MDEKALEALKMLKSFNALREHYKDAAGVETATRLHGIGGIFSTPGLERDIVTAHVRPTGIATVLPLLPSNSEDPRFGALTGYGETAGVAEPTAACGDAPKGYVKSCMLTARFGLTRRDTEEIDMMETGLKVNRGDFTDLILRGRTLGLSGLTPQNMDESDILTIMTKSEMVIAAINAERRLVQQMWQGTWGQPGEFPGLDNQINTGIVDADTNVACPALDSDIKDFAYDQIGGGNRSIVDYVGMLEFYIHHNAVRMGLMPVTWVWVMRPELWQELTEVWPCEYNTNKCASATLGTNSRTVIDGRENIAQRDSMRERMEIDVNGRTYSVVLDDGIFEANNINNANLAAGEYASSIYFVPVTVQGMPVTYREYIDYRGSVVNENVDLLRGTERFWSDDGVYSWALTDAKWCVQLHLRTQQRVILRTPHLAGKIQNVKYVPLQHLRSPFTDNAYFADGGVSLRAGTSFNQVWGNG